MKTVKVLASLFVLLIVGGVDATLIRFLYYINDLTKISDAPWPVQVGHLVFVLITSLVPIGIMLLISLIWKQEE